MKKLVLLGHLLVLLGLVLQVSVTWIHKDLSNSYMVWFKDINFIIKPQRYIKAFSYLIVITENSASHFILFHHCRYNVSWFSNSLRLIFNCLRSSCLLWDRLMHCYESFHKASFCKDFTQLSHIWRLVESSWQWIYIRSVCIFITRARLNNDCVSYLLILLTVCAGNFLHSL